ncbi:hypothetical protein [Streptomyces sp. NPDC050738]|uniref:hypothetical protein n=1 Tax=Streptomyces sp. NPDC050738 TaxID=3154744 RepID=UPI003413A9E6
MTDAKVAAVVAGSVMALGVASPAFADDVDNSNGMTAAGSDNLVQSDTVSKNVVKKPNINIDAVVGAVTKATDKLKATQDTAAKSVVGARNAAGPTMGGLPLGG